MDNKGLAVIQQRYDSETKHTYRTEIDSWMTDPLYLHLRFNRVEYKLLYEKKGGCTMNILNKVLSKIPIKKKVKKPSLIKEIRDKPEEFILEAFIENDEIIMKIKRKES